MPAILITGANRGIGLALARQYAADGWRVHATAREPRKADELNAIDGADVHALDVTDHSAIAQLAEKIDEPLDVVVANAGVGGKNGDGSSVQFGNVDYDAFRKVLEVNLFGALATAEAFTEHLKKGEQKKLVCISSLMGSIGDTSGGALSYRTSKAALNMAMQASAAQLAADGIATAVLHPGWVKTDMGGPSAPTSVEDSAKGLREVIDGIWPQNRAFFLDYTGKQLPW